MSVQRWSAQIWLARLAVDPAFTEDIDMLLEQTTASRTPPHVVLDLSGVEHLNSSNLSHLLRLRKRLIDGDARLRLAAPTDHIWALFLATGLDKVFGFAVDTPTALAELQLQT